MLSGGGLRIAIPSKGRLKGPSLELLKKAGLRFRISERRLFAVCSDTETRLIFCNTADIPTLVAKGVVDLGVTGSDQVAERGVDVIQHRELGFGRCRLAVAVHKDAGYRVAADLSGKVVGTKFLNLARRYLEEQGAKDVQLLEIQGAVEVMVLLGLVDGIVEVVETGNSLVENDLIELGDVLPAEAVLIGNASPRDVEARDLLLRRVDGVLVAARYSLLEYNCPAARIEDATRITPGFSSPTVTALQDEKWLAVKVLVEKSSVHRVMDDLEKLGCAAILETELTHARL